MTRFSFLNLGMVLYIENANDTGLHLIHIPVQSVPPSLEMGPGGDGSKI